MKTIGILTGGGDVPGLNPCIKAVVMSALEEGYRVFGITRGWAGLLHYDPDESSTHDDNVRNLERKDVRTVDRTGGTFLHTSRTNPSNMNPEKVPDFLKSSKWGKRIDENGNFVAIARNCVDTTPVFILPVFVTEPPVPAIATIVTLNSPPRS